MHVLYAGGECYVEGVMPPPEYRYFLKIWMALSLETTGSPATTDVGSYLLSDGSGIHVFPWSWLMKVCPVEVFTRQPSFRLMEIISMEITSP
jgi:hypothetical protein